MVPGSHPAPGAGAGCSSPPVAAPCSYSGAMPLPPLCDPGPPLDRDQVLRYSRHLLLEQFGELGQRRLRAARVLVMGAGGLGSPILHYLAAAGIGHVGIVDDDVVETTNLQRQVLHTTADVGRPKTTSAAEHVRALNPEVEVTEHHLRMDATNAREIIGAYDIVLDGTDNFPTRYLVADVCADLGVPLVWGSILRFDSQVAVFWSRPPQPAEGPAYPAVTLRDLFPSPPPPGATPSCGQAGVLGAMCGQVGSLMAAEAIKLITGIGEPLLGRVAVLDVLAARWHEVELRPAAPELRAAPAPAPAAAPHGPQIGVSELAALLAARDRGEADFVLVDVREETEREIATIPGAVSLPLSRLLANPATAAREAELDSARRILLHCLAGGRARRAQAALQELDLAATAVAGGVREWAATIDPDTPTY